MFSKEELMLESVCTESSIAAVSGLDRICEIKSENIGFKSKKIKTEVKYN